MSIMLTTDASSPAGADNNLALWDANGNKIRSIITTNDLPLRVTFSHDDSTVFASDFSGHITAYTAKDGKLIGELDANPPPFARQSCQSQTRCNYSVNGQM